MIKNQESKNKLKQNNSVVSFVNLNTIDLSEGNKNKSNNENVHEISPNYKRFPHRTLYQRNNNKKKCTIESDYLSRIKNNFFDLTMIDSKKEDNP